MTLFWGGLFVMLVASLEIQAAPPLPIPVTPLSVAPVVDGVLDEWGKEGWVEVVINPAVKDDPDHAVGPSKVQMKAGRAGERIYFAARWSDEQADVEYRPWKWVGKQYKRGKQRDDMFIVRFDMGGDYDSCMLSKKEYKVDLWQWSAGRSNLAGLAEDFTHIISTNPVENAAEYEHPEGGMVYIRKIRDEGELFYETVEAGKEKTEETLPGIKMVGAGSGSLIDVSAKGLWKDGFWNLELSRKLDTGHADDVKLTGLKEIKGAIAVFNKGFAEHKSVSDTLVFVF
ncbi:MAG: hypothetical protein HQL93_12820 [Magnetococcales bacterium]|nr:hypothetical protein [Magnetococcales bacterium]